MPGTQLNSAEYRPIVVGIIWPSTLLVLPWESAPHIAGGAPGVPDEERAEMVGADQQAVSDVASELDPQQVRRLYHLAERGQGLTPDEARELATLLLPVYKKSSTEM